MKNSQCSLDIGGVHRLISAALLVAVQDVKRGLPCGCQCSKDVHFCFIDAWHWLNGDGLEWLDALGISPDAFIGQLNKHIMLDDFSVFERLSKREVA
jgi:hypothetical protein